MMEVDWENPFSFIHQPFSITSVQKQGSKSAINKGKPLVQHF